jgi:hypothetical protein
MPFKRASRVGSHVLISLTGQSGSGKTYTALRLARGLVGPEGKIAGLDTESGRMSLYSDVAGGFDVDELHEPFSPDRYIEKITEAQQAGYRVLIIDSVSHEWEGTGSVTEMADEGKDRQGKPLDGLLKWAKPKAKHKLFINKLLQTPMHLILCCRAKEKLRQIKDDQGKNVIISDGWVTIQEKNFIYEMTVSVLMTSPTDWKLTKCPDDLRAAFSPGGYISEDTGRRISEWVNGANPLDDHLEQLKRDGFEAADAGIESVASWWKALPRDSQQLLAPFREAFKLHAQNVEAGRD